MSGRQQRRIRCYQSQQVAHQLLRVIVRVPGRLLDGCCQLIGRKHPNVAQVLDYIEPVSTHQVRQVSVVHADEHVHRIGQRLLIGHTRRVIRSRQIREIEQLLYALPVRKALLNVLVVAGADRRIERVAAR